MPTLILSMLALLGCAFLVYVFFQWLRDELNPKRPVSRGRLQHPTAGPGSLSVIRRANRQNLQRIVRGR
jgi:threonine/homoserine/homoserine lactone efflux protein